MVLVGNVIFMNFIVAVVSESYEKCMQSQTVQQYRLRCDMIVERESIMTPEEFEDKDKFPRYLVVRQAAEDEQMGAQEQWRGFLRELKGFIKREVKQVASG